MKELSPAGRRNVRRASAPRGRPEAQKRVSVQIPEGQPPHVTFALRAKGTLPEIVTEADLETLNSGLRFLFDGLREARRRFESEGDGGRFGAFKALAAAWMFIRLFKAPDEENLHVPIHRVQEGLSLLEQNVVLEMFKPVRRRGRGPSSHAYSALKGHAAATVRRLVESGLPPTEARRAVSKLLNLLKVRSERGSGKITADTVRHWCDEVSSDVGKHTAGSAIYDSLFVESENARFSALAPERARSVALSDLSNWVLYIRPDGQNPVNPPI
jgi:hypothetical protein